MVQIQPRKRGVHHAGYTDNSAKVILDGFETKHVTGVIPCLMSSKLSSVLGEIRAYLGSPQSRKVTFGNSC